MSGEHSRTRIEPLRIVSRQLDSLSIIDTRRYEALLDKLVRPVEGKHPDTIQRYVDIVDIEVTDESPDLPLEAEICEDPITLLIIMENHLKDIELYLKLRTTVNRQISVPGLRVEEMKNEFHNPGPLRPMVGGYIWFRGYRITDNSRNSALFFKPHIDPLALISPFPEIYTIGDTTPNFCQKIAKSYYGIKEDF